MSIEKAIEKLKEAEGYIEYLLDAEILPNERGLGEILKKINQALTLLQQQPKCKTCGDTKKVEYEPDDIQGDVMVPCPDCQQPATQKAGECTKCRGTRIVDDSGLIIVEAITNGLVKAHHPPRIYPCPKCCSELHNKVALQYKEMDKTINDCEAEKERLKEKYTETRSPRHEYLNDKVHLEAKNKALKEEVKRMQTSMSKALHPERKSY